MAKHLRAKGVAHVVFDNLSTGHRAAVGSSPFVEGDLRHPSDLYAAFERFRPETILHFAAKSLVGESLAQPHTYWENNVVGGWNLLEAMRSFRVHQIVFSSTAAIYGNPASVPIEESAPKQPLSPYGESKLAFERMLGNYDRAYGIRSVCLRYFNAAGCDPEGELGEDHRPETHLIPAAIDAAIAGETVRVFGDNYPTPDGTCLRDYVHVSDLCDAHWLAMRHLADRGESRRYNLGSGRGFSVHEVLGSIRAVTGLPLKTEVVARREGDPAVLIASSVAIERDWGWRPVQSDLKTMVAHAANWRAHHPEGYGEGPDTGKPRG